MDKLAIGPGHRPGTVTMAMSPAERVSALAAAKGCSTEDITVCILERPRHEDLIAEVRSTGAAIRLITDGDVAGVIHTASPEETGIDIYMGQGGAPEGVLAAAALRCIGGQMQGRLSTKSMGQRERAARMGIADFDRKMTLSDMASGDVMFAATGVTTGSLLRGVHTGPGFIETETVVMRSATGTVRWIRNRKKV
jgi:fructose-1,6-bisphosphatase II / sedoheptulose-1,7-bisphosphatase